MIYLPHEKKVSPLHPRGKKMARMIIYWSTDVEDDNSWRPLYPNQVPGWIREDPDILSEMVDGMLVQKDDMDIWYRAELSH